MKPILLVAFSDEIDAIVKQFRLSKPQAYCHTTIWNGKLFRMIQTGIGKVNAAATTQLVIEREHPKYLINIGLAGGFTAKTKVGDIVIPKDVIQYDIDLRCLGRPLGQLSESTSISLPLLQPKQRVEGTISGRCLTGDRIVTDKKFARQLNDMFHPTVIDMELGAIAQVCLQNNVQLLALKGITDIIEKAEILVYKERVSLCMANIFPVLQKVLTII